MSHVVNRHLHFDHCGRNAPFAGAVTLVQAAGARLVFSHDLDVWDRVPAGVAAGNETE